MFQPHSSQCWGLGPVAELTPWALGFKQKALDVGGDGQVMHTWGTLLVPQHRRFLRSGRGQYKKLSTPKDWSRELDLVSQSRVLSSLLVPLENMKKTQPSSDKPALCAPEILFRSHRALCRSCAALGPRREGCDLGESCCHSRAQESSPHTESRG